MSSKRVSYSNLFPQQQRLNNQTHFTSSNQEKSDGSSIIITPSNRNTRKKKENVGKPNQIDQFHNFSYFTPSNFNNFTNEFDDFTSSLNRNSTLYIKENDSNEEASNDKENMYDPKKFLRIEKSKCYEIDRQNDKEEGYKRGSMLSKYNNYNADRRNSSFLNNTYMNNNNNNTNTSIISNNFDCSMISEYLIKPNKDKQNKPNRQSSISFPGQSFRNKSFSQKRIKSINEIAPEDMIDYDDNENDNEKERMINIKESFMRIKKNKRVSSRLKLNESIIINDDKSSIDDRNEEENEEHALNTKDFQYEPRRNSNKNKENLNKNDEKHRYAYNSKQNHSIDNEGSENKDNYITTINEYSTPSFPSSNKENSLGFSSKRSYINLKRHVSSENMQKNSKKTPKTASFKNTSISNVNNTNKSTVNDIIEEADEGNEDQTAKKSSKRKENNEERIELEENIRSTRLFELEDKENKNLNKKNKEENRNFDKKQKESPSISVSQSIIRQKDSQTSMNSTINFLNLNNLNNEYINKRPVAEYKLNGHKKDKYYLSSGNKKYHTLNNETDRDDIDLYTDLYINEGKNQGFHQENHQKYNKHHLPVRKESFLEENEKISNFSQRNTVQSIGNIFKNEKNQKNKSELMKISKDDPSKINKETQSFQSIPQVFNKNKESNDFSRRSYIKLNENFRQLSEIPKALLSNTENNDNYSQLEGMTSKIKNENYKLTLQSTNTNKSTIFNDNDQGSESSRDDYTYNKVPITKEYAALYKSPDEKDDFTIKVNKKHIFSMNPIEKSATIDVVTSNISENNRKGGVIELFNNILLKIDNIKNQKSSRRFNPSPIREGNSNENKGKAKEGKEAKESKEGKENSHHMQKRQVKTDDKAGKNKKILIKNKKSYIESIKLIQKAYRNYINQQNITYESEIYKKIVLIQSNFKGFYLRKTLLEMINKYESQRNLQVLYKNSMINIFSSLRLFTHKYSAILFIQSSIRQWLVRNKEFKSRMIFDGVMILKNLIQKTYFSFFSKMETYIDYISNEETRAVEYIEYIDRMIKNRYAYYKYFFIEMLKKNKHEKGRNYVNYVKKTRKVSCLSKESMKRLGSLIVDCDCVSKMFIKQLYFIEWYEKSQKLRVLYEKTHGFYGKNNQNSQKNINYNSKTIESYQFSKLSQGNRIICRIIINKSREILKSAFKKMILFKKQENSIKNFNSNLTFKPYNNKKLSLNMNFSLKHLLFNYYLLVHLQDFSKKLYVKDLINVFLYIKINILSKTDVISSKSLIEIKIKDKFFDVLYKKPNLLYSSSGNSLKLKEIKQKTNDNHVGFNISIPSAGCQLKRSQSKSKSSNRRSFYRTIKRNNRK